MYGLENRPKISVPTPKGQRKQEVNWNLQSFANSDLSLKDFDVQEHVIMHVEGVIMVQQYTISKGLKLIGDGERLAVKKELTQLHDMTTYTPMHAHELPKSRGNTPFHR
jgi:hypothetical protein